MSIKIIKNERDREQAFARLEMLAAEEPKPGSAESDEIDVIVLLIEQYEMEVSPVELPDPVSAIEFRMEQQQLSRKDMAVYLGSLSRVSEVLGRKKPLNLTMIRNLHEGLEIPYDVLMQKPKPVVNDYSAYPLNAIYKAGYFNHLVSSLAEFKSQANTLIDKLFSEAGSQLTPAHLRSTTNDPNGSSKKIMDEFALSIWQAQVLKLAKENTAVETHCDISAIDENFLAQILRLSKYKDGPLRAKKALAEAGIHFIVLPHLPKTYLDGAAMLGDDGNPIVGMTLRYDRLDNFWFVLMHELAHVSKHLKEQDAFWADNMDEDDGSEIEEEANTMASEALMSDTEWQEAKDFLITPDTVVAMARRFDVHPAIIAGRYRKDTGDYRIFNRLIGSKEVRKQFGLR